MIGNSPHEDTRPGILEKDRKKGEQHQGDAHAPQIQIGNPGFDLHPEGCGYYAVGQ